MRKEVREMIDRIELLAIISKALHHIPHPKLDSNQGKQKAANDNK